MKNISIEQSSFEQSVMIISVATISILLEEENSWDLIALYMFYQRQSKLQSTNISFTNSQFVMNWLKWWRDRFSKAKNILIKKWIIEDYCKRNEKWQVEWWYIKLNFIQSLPDENESTLLETQSLDEPKLGEQTTNAWNIKNINAWSIKSLNAWENFEIPNKEKEVIEIQEPSSLYGSSSDKNTKPNKKKKLKKEVELKEHSEYKKVTRNELIESGKGTKLQLRIIDILEAIEIYEDIDMEKFNAIYELIIKLGKEAFPNIFYQDPETWAWYWTATILGTIDRFIGYYANNPEAVILSLSGRLRTWFANTSKFK